MVSTSSQVTLSPGSFSHGEKPVGRLTSPTNEGVSSFKEVLRAMRNPTNQPSVDVSQSFRDVVSQVTTTWDGANTLRNQQLQRIPADAKALFDMQLLANRLHLQTELLAKTGETANSSLRRIQQMGAG